MLAGEGNKSGKEYSTNPINYSIDLTVDENQSELHVIINGTVEDKMVISLINLKGQESYYSSLKELKDQYEATIDLSQLMKGVYFLKIDSGDEIRMKKITL